MKNGLRQSCPDEFLELEREHSSDSPSLTLAQLAAAGELRVFQMKPLPEKNALSDLIFMEGH